MNLDGVTSRSIGLDDLENTEIQLAITLSRLEATENELAALRQVYPLKRFPNLNALRAWLDEQPITSFTRRNVQAMQEQAARDGYLVAACFMSFPGQSTTYIWVSAVLANGDIYWWEPDDHTLNYLENIN